VAQCPSRGENGRKCWVPMTEDSFTSTSIALLLVALRVRSLDGWNKSMRSPFCGAVAYSARLSRFVVPLVESWQNYSHLDSARAWASDPNVETLKRPSLTKCVICHLRDGGKCQWPSKEVLIVKQYGGSSHIISRICWNPQILERRKQT
jgi:hypothetical protein